jgi:hypothetical protein
MNRNNTHTSVVTPRLGYSAPLPCQTTARRVRGGATALLLTLCIALAGLAVPSHAQQNPPNPRQAFITSFQYTATGLTLNWTAQSSNSGITIPFGNYRPYCQYASNGNTSFSCSGSSPVATYNPNTNLWTETGTFTVNMLQPSTTYRFFIVGSNSSATAPLIYSSNYALFTTLAANP